MTNSPSASILVVDDNRTNRLLLERRLATEGFRVSTAEGGAQALEQLHETLHDPAAPHPIDLAILDVMMPDVDGLEVLRRIRETKSPIDLPVVMATAREAPEDIVAALKGGANDYVVKPINFPVLLARIETQLALKGAREALKSAQQSLIDTAKMESVGYLAAGVAHEIRNPLARIQMAIRTLQRADAVQSDDKLRRCVDSLQSSCEKADQVVGGLMQVAGDSRPNLVALDLESVIGEALDMISEPIEAQGIDLRLELDGELPPARGALTELRQVLVNVLLNAVQATPRGGTLLVHAGVRTLEDAPATSAGRSGNVLRKGDSVLVIEVNDSGPGIPEDDLLTVFDAFYTTKPTGLATGLGLTVAKKILELQGGTISLENREEGGTRASIVLPKAGGFQTSV